MASPPLKRARLEESLQRRSPGTASSSTMQGFVVDLKENGTCDGDPVEPGIDNSPFTHKGKNAALKPDLELYYDATASAADCGPGRALRILALSTSSSQDQLNPCTKLIAGWSKGLNTINLFLEGGIHAPVSRQCHLQFPSDISPINGGDIRRQLALHLGLEDAFTIQLELQRQPSRADTSMIKHSDGTCRRVRAPWNDITIDDRKPVTMSIPSSEPSTSGDHLWIRVSNVEYIVLDAPQRDQIVALTPEREATVGDVRALAAQLYSTNPEAIHLELFDQELLMDDFPLLFQGVAPQMSIYCRFEYVECAICGDSDIPYGELAVPITTTCIGHARETCNDCVQQWIVTKLDSGDWEKIGCPGINCKEILQYDDIVRTP
jgi:hypothetical protein